MICPRCDTENPANAQTCLTCGLSLAAYHESPAVAGGVSAQAVPSPAHLRQATTARRYEYDGPDDNTSGWGAQKSIPDYIRGWSFVGFVPFGMFALYNGQQAWGVAGILLTVLTFPFGFLAWPLMIGYAVYLGLKGRELAWHGRRFASAEEYEQTMRAWNIAGMISLVLPPLQAIWHIMFWMKMFSLFTLDPTGTPGGCTDYT
ncbi:zinc ribbon domain-containing protein [bacterium]|nr:zinc ribbon domain-containing protein [bacterium]